MNTNEHLRAGIPVVARNGEEGRLTGASHICRLSGCTGLKLTVKWADGTHTFPCTKGMLYGDGKWVIQ